MRPIREIVEDIADEQPVDEQGHEESGLDLLKHWITFDAEQLAADPPEKEFVWAGRIPLGEAGVIAADGGSGKTALLVGLAIARATGAPFLGRAVRPGTTVIVTKEDKRDDYLRKFAAWRSWLPSLDLDDVAKHVHVVDLVGQPFRLIQSHFGEYVATAHVEMLATAIKAKAPDADLVIVETVSRVGGDESNPAMAALVDAAEELVRMTGATVILVTHVSQDAGRRAIGDAHAPRGGTALGANGRFTLTMTRLVDEAAAELLPGIVLSPQQRKEMSVFRVAKINAAPREDPTILQIVPTKWGLVLREYDSGQGQTEEERKHALRGSIGEHLRTMAERMASLSDPLTTSKLQHGLYKDIPGLSRQRVASAVADAIEDGLLQTADRPGRGGGRVLLPGNARAEQFGDSSASEAP